MNRLFSQSIMTMMKAKRATPLLSMLALVALLLPACAQAPADSPASIQLGLRSLLGEAIALTGLVTSGTIFTFVLLASVGLFAFGIFRAAVVGLWRVGFDSSRQLARVLLFGRFIAFGWVPFALTLGAFKTAPVLTSLLIPVILILLGLVFQGLFRDIAAGIDNAFSARIRVADHISLGGSDGFVRDLGLTRVQLRGLDGARMYVPNRFLFEGTTRISRERTGYPVQVTVLARSTDSFAMLQTHLKKELAFSPFRVPGTSLSVEFDPTKNLIALKIHTWSEQAVSDAEAHLRQAVEALVSHHSELSRSTSAALETIKLNT